MRIGGQGDGRVGRVLLLGLLVALACQASTTRPTFSPLPNALTAQLRLEVPEGFDTLLAAFRADSIPMARVEARDGFFDSGWLTSPDLRATAERPVGLGFVRIRGWIDLGKPYHTQYTVETVYRVRLDPSREDRELEMAVADTHPASLRVRRILSGVLARHGDPEDQKADSVAAAWIRARMRTGQPRDTSARPRAATAPGDTTAPRDTAATHPDRV